MPESYYKDQELFKGTAWYYARYRKGYPPEIFQLLVERFKLDGRGCLLDLGCGPGDLAIPLSSCFENVIALDADREMLEEGQMKARHSGFTNIRWLQGRAEELPDDLGGFRLVTIGKAFHWMDQQLVLSSVYQKLRSGGGLAIIGELGRLWGGREQWHSVVLAVIKKYLGEERRAGKGVAKFSGARWENLLDGIFARAEFNNSIVQKDVWDVDSLTGFLYSTSACSREMLGDNVESFEHDLKEALMRHNPANRFEEDIPISVLMGWM